MPTPGKDWDADLDIYEKVKENLMSKTLLDRTDEKEESSEIEESLRESLLEQTHNLSDINKKIFRLKYKRDPGVTKEIVFVADGHADAVERARAYCKRFKHRFIYVEDFIVRLEDLTE